jgi:ABC-type spermidine/putrescine transport system permease subunit II
MDQMPPNSTKIATKWAVISALTSIVLTYAIQFANIDSKSPVNYLSSIPFIIFLLLAQKEFKDANGGFISFNQAFSTGFRFSVFAGLIMAVFIFIYLKVLSPEVLEKAMETQRDQMHEKGMSDGDIEKAISMGKNLGPVFGAFGVAIFDALFGLVVSLIGAAVFKKERSPFDNDLTIDPAV